MNNLDDIIELNPETLPKLKEAYKNQKLVIAVGAGASCQSGLPTWNGLIDRLFTDFVSKRYTHSIVNPIIEDIKVFMKHQMGDSTPIVMAHYLQSHLTEKQFLDIVYSSLYNTFKEIPIPGAITKSVAKLCKGLKSVITFNFDELIELALTMEGIDNTSVWLEKHLNAIKGIPVIHPHGFLPFNRKENEPYWVVLAESDYHKQYYDSNSWSNKQLQMIFAEFTCLFVSTSITDPNLRRLLDLNFRNNPEKLHFFLWSKPRKEEFQDKLEEISYNAYEEVFKDSFNRIGLEPIWFRYRGNDPDKVNPDPNYNWNDIPQIMKFIGKE